MRLRFAPSPSGLLHIGNFRSALINWLYACRYNGTYVLRFDDTDQQRSQKQFAEEILKDLQWAGIVPNEIYYQSQRHALYQQAIQRLKHQGRLYPCYETAEELDQKRQQQLAQGKAPRYDRAALSLTPQQRQLYADQGRLPHWRFLLNDTPIFWHDSIRGDSTFVSKNLSDPVIVREDNTPLYSFASVVDDIDLNITHIIRGEDHVSNTAVQLQMFEALGKTDLTFAHFPWILDEKGQGFSKRLGSLSLQQLREQGMQPLTLSVMIARLGTSDPIDSSLQYQDIINHFDLEKFSRSAVRLNMEDLWKFNRKVIQNFSYTKITEYLEHMGGPVIEEEFWNAIRPNIKILTDIQDWWTICQTQVTPILIDSALTHFAAETFPGLNTPDWWAVWMTHLKQTGKSGKALFLPLRLALTGQEHGPELKELIPLLGEHRVRYRLQGQSI